MSENKDTLKDLFNRLTLQEQNKVIDFAYLYDDIRGLRNQLQQKENIIKEVREYILTHKLYCFKYDDEELFEITTDKKAKDELLEILDKENK